MRVAINICVQQFCSTSCKSIQKTCANIVITSHCELAGSQPNGILAILFQYSGISAMIEVAERASCQVEVAILDSKRAYSVIHVLLNSTLVGVYLCTWLLTLLSSLPSYISSWDGTLLPIVGTGSWARGSLGLLQAHLAVVG